MSLMPWLRRHLPSPAATRRLNQRFKNACRPTIIQLEDRLVPSNSVTVSVVSPPPTFFEGVAVNLTSVVDAPNGTPTYAWTVLKDGVSFATGATADLSFTPRSAQVTLV